MVGERALFTFYWSQFGKIFIINALDEPTKPYLDIEKGKQALAEQIQRFSGEFTARQP